ncbi:hypothetical protein ACFV6U_05465 [Streptomyces sp. NPDC059810]|uniref:hypothetical protein n=1 Tax=Streptomyces sp. NPDC059810 TaxID=3346956 RepID=UPI0036573681
MDDVRGTVYAFLYGPAERFDEALAALHAAGITAARDIELGAILAKFSDGTDNPSKEFREQCRDRAIQAATGTRFTVDEQRIGVMQSSAASLQVTHNRHTGEYLGQLIDTDAPLFMREEQLQRLADEKGITVNDIELRDPPYMTPPTE